MEEELLNFDEIDITPEKKKKEKGLIEIPDKLEYKGTILSEVGSGLSKIVDKVKGKEVEEEATLVESLTGATVSSAIKIPKGIITFATLLNDTFKDANIPVEETATAQFNEWFDRTWLGKIENASEEVAHETASGKILEAFGQLYGGSKIAMKLSAPVIKSVAKHSKNLVNAIKTGRYAKTTNNVNAARTVKKVKDLNKAAGFEKFVGIAVGGGIGTGFIVSDIENIGTFGDWDFLDFLPTGLDREQRESGSEDAKRQLLNRFKFGSELAFPIIPAVYAVGKTGKLLVQKGKDLAYSDKLIERWINRWVGQPFRSRSNKTQELFDGIQKLEGKNSAVKVLAEDAARNFDDSLRRISKSSRGAAQSLKNPETLSSQISNFMFATDDIVKEANIIFPGFSKASIKAFTDSLKRIGIKQQVIDDIISDAATFRRTAAGLKNTIASSKNVVVGKNKLNQILNDRAKNVLSTDYRIIDDNTGIFSGYKPTKDSIDKVVKILQKYAKNNEKTLDTDSANKLVSNILKKAFIDPTTKALTFPIGTQSALDDAAVQIKNMGKYISQGKFKPDKDGGLIQTVSDFQAFQKLFGSYKNAQNGIYNVMTDLSEILARDRFYTDLLKDSNNIAKALKAGGDAGKIGRPIFFKSYDDAILKLPHQNIITTPLKLKTGLPDTVYSSPLDGMFTTKPYAEAIKVGDQLVGSGLTKSLPYRMLMLIPKGLSQAAKTVLGPFTHARNFFSAMITTIHRGNILIPPNEIFNFANQARRTVQPQLLYRLTGNPKYRNQPADQALYRFLLEEGVVNKNIVAQEVEGIFADIGRMKPGSTADQYFKKVLNSATSKFKKLYQTSVDLYTAEDDIFRVYNFLAESFKLNRAFDKAIKNKVRDATGKLVKKPSEFEILKEAAEIVRETVPNYAYVSDFVKGVRRSPLGSFASFPAEIFRTGGNTLVRGLKEARDPVRRQIGLNSLIGQGFTYAFLPPAAVEAFRGLYGITREQLTALREVLPTWSEDNTILPIYEDGQYKYIDFSHGFFYDTMIQPAQTVISGVQKDIDEPLVPTILTGMTKAMGKVLEPFIQESIWFGAMADIFIRGGVDKEGRKLWNDRDSLGRKWQKAAQHVAYELSPFSYAQVKRLYKASLGETVKGINYEIPDELLGLTGFRKVPINLERALNFEIQKFKRDERDERNLIYEGTRTGDPVDDPNKVIKQYIFANKQRLETFNKMRRFYDSVKVLGMRDDKILEEFMDRGAKDLYGYIEDNEFKPFRVGKNMILAYEKMAEEKGIPNPLNDQVLDILEALEDYLYDAQRLNKDFVLTDEIIEKFLIKSKGSDDEAKLQTPPLEDQPMPSSEVVSNTQIPDVSQTGLTQTEQALLSQEEKAIRLRQRGLQT